MRFRSAFLNWIVENPSALVGLLIVVALLLFALSPLLMALLPMRKVPLRYNLRNLQVRWLTTMVTALAFTMVTALLTVMLAFVNGMDQLTAQTGHPGNVLILSDGATDEVFSSLPPVSVQSLPDDVQKQISKNQAGEYLAAQEVYVLVTYLIPGKTKRRFMQMRGLDNPRIAAELHELELEPGGDWPSDSGIRSVETTVDGKQVKDTYPEIVIGDGIAKTLGGDVGKAQLVPGDVVEIGPKKWVVSGVMKPNGSAFGSEIWTRDRVVQENFGRRNSYSTYVVRTANEKVATAACEVLKKTPLAERNVQAQPERVFYAKLGDTSKQFSVAIYFVAIIMAIGGLLGVMNTMFAAISQRTKDIGVLRLMGYTKLQIFLSFQLESLLIAILGGSLGCLIGLCFDGLTASSIIASGAGGGGKGVVLTLVVNLATFCTGMFFALMMGTIGGIFPSYNAMRLRPLESLK
jgi:putative ABC transport system permease protein